MLYEFRKGIAVGAATKNIQEVYLDRTVDDDVLRVLITNNASISMEDAAEALNIDRSIAFRYLKKMEFTLKLDGTWILHSLTKNKKKTTPELG
ncbi:hypothetical protein ALC53_11159 [Atta colombica]|uniref:Histone-lysine N-methyltransferase SETMAR n=1 Tax=Atta colombica TaxID=520822 RepID=A0A195B2S6_9HYME|nr:hypothetical protein ALC53_11159 [Atta colombica]